MKRQRSPVRDAMARGIVEHARQGIPLGNEWNMMFQSVSNVELAATLRLSGVRDILYRPALHMAEALANLPPDMGVNPLEPQLKHFMRWTFRGKTSSPTAGKMVHEVRTQFAQLCGNLQPDVARRLRHVFNVQITNTDTKRALLPYVAMTYGHDSGEVPDQLVPLATVRVYWTDWVVAQAGYVSTMLHSGHLCMVDADSNTFSVVAGDIADVDFSYVPMYGASPDKLDLKDLQAYEAGLACCQEAEIARASGRIDDGMLPSVWLKFAGEDAIDFDPDPHQSGYCTEEFTGFVMDRWQDWWNYRGDVQRLVDVPWHNYQPVSRPTWPDVLAEQGNLYRTANWHAMMAQLGQERGDRFLRACWLASMVAVPGGIAMPARFLTDHQAPVQRSVGILAGFPSRLMGRDTYQPGLVRDYSLPRVMVMKAE